MGPPMTINEAAEWAKVSRETVERLIKRGDLPAFSLPPPSRARRIWLDDLVAWATGTAKG